MKHKKSRRFRGFDPDQFQKDVTNPELINECQYLTDRIALRIQLVDLLTKVMRLVPPNFIERLNLAKKIGYEEFHNTYCASMDSAYDQLSFIEMKFLSDHKETPLGKEVMCEVIYKHANGML